MHGHDQLLHVYAFIEAILFKFENKLSIGVTIMFVVRHSIIISIKCLSQTCILSFEIDEISFLFFFIFLNS